MLPTELLALKPSTSLQPGCPTHLPSQRAVKAARRPTDGQQQGCGGIGTAQVTSLLWALGRSPASPHTDGRGGRGFTLRRRRLSERGGCSAIVSLTSKQFTTPAPAAVVATGRLCRPVAKQRAAEPVRVRAVRCSRTARGVPAYRHCKADTRAEDGRERKRLSRLISAC